MPKNMKLGATKAFEISGSTGVKAYDENEVEIKLAPLASPAFTGTPTAPTPTSGDNSTKIATTEFVKSNTPSVNVDDASTTQKGIVQLATQAEVDAGTVNNKAVTPNTLPGKITSAVNSLGFSKIVTGSYTGNGGMTSVTISGLSFAPKGALVVARTAGTTYYGAGIFTFASGLTIYGASIININVTATTNSITWSPAAGVGNGGNILNYSGAVYDYIIFG